MGTSGRFEVTRQKTCTVRCRGRNLAGHTDKAYVRGLGRAFLCLYLTNQWRPVFPPVLIQKIPIQVAHIHHVAAILPRVVARMLFVLSLAAGTLRANVRTQHVP